jgi:hypothetical protein
MHCRCLEGDPDAARPVVPAASFPPPVACRSGWCRWLTTVLEWGAPVIALALMPKCPACVAGYLLLFTGIGLSFPAAAAVRFTLIFVSIAALAYLILFRLLRRSLSLRS